MRNQGRIRLNLAAGTVAFALLGVGCASTTTRQSTVSVVLVGDSLAEQAAQYLEPLLGAKTLVPQYFGGTAACDWLEKDLQITSGSAVVISLTGNSMSPCMSDCSGAYLQGQAAVEK